MAAPATAAMPSQMDLSGGYTVRLTAVDPTTGNVISSITIASMVMLIGVPAGAAGSSGSGGLDQLAYGPFLLVPGPGA